MNLFGNVVGSVWDSTLCIKTRLFEILSRNKFKIFLSQICSLTCVKLSLQWGRGEHKAFNIKEIPTQGFAIVSTSLYGW